MHRILHVVNSMGVGGTETVLMNLYRAVNRERFQFDFVVHTQGETSYEAEIRELGGRVFRTQKYLVYNYLPYVRWWQGHLAAHPEHRVIHGHMGSAAPVYLDVANRDGRISIAHSHSTRNPEHNLRTLAWETCSWPTRLIARNFLACSYEAGVDRFGARVVGSERFHVMKNGIDTARFAYNEHSRRGLRQELGLQEGQLAVGHVGRFTSPKNHLWLLHVFAEVLAKEPDAVLLLVGQGELEAQVRAQAWELGLSESVRFLGVHSDVERYYAAMDVFCFPSHWEGLGMVAVEAQTSGLPVVASEAVPTVADIGAGLLRRLSLDESAEVWAEALLASAAIPRGANALEAVRKAGYDVTDVASWLQGYYERLDY